MMQRMHGRRSRKKAMRYRMMTSIWSCMMSAHADLGTNNTGNIQCKQYILHQIVALPWQRKSCSSDTYSSQEMYHYQPVILFQTCSDEWPLSFSKQSKVNCLLCVLLYSQWSMYNTWLHYVKSCFIALATVRQYTSNAGTVPVDRVSVICEVVEWGTNIAYYQWIFSLVTSPCTPPGEKRSGERSRISWAYYPKVVRTNKIARSVIIT